MLVREILAFSTEFLKYIENPKFSAESIIAYFLGCSRLNIYLYLDKKIDKKIILPFLKRRAEGEPLEYILKKIEFYNCELYLTKDVLIPRNETEYFLELICENIEDAREIWDIGTGSGAIAISLKKRFPHLNVTASDISEKALKIAKKNAFFNKVDISFLKGDLFNPFNKKADIIISNPPYVSLKEYKNIFEYVKYEPKIAFIAKDDGLGFYKRIEKDVLKYLNDGGKVFLEIRDEKDKIEQIFSKNRWSDKKFFEDIYGKTRYIFLKK